jgi:hypothetical protein
MRSENVKLTRFLSEAINVSARTGSSFLRIGCFGRRRVRRCTGGTRASVRVSGERTDRAAHLQRAEFERAFD